MANCPYCAEQYGLRQVFMHTDCGACGLPVKSDENGRVETYASKHAIEILQQPLGVKYWLLFLGGILATLIFSVIPALGIVTAILLPFLQVFCLERSIHRYQEHFGFLHNLTVDFYSSLLFLVMIITQSIANFALGPVSALVNVPLFLGIWGLYTLYSKMHFRQVVAHQRPSLFELLIIGLIIFLIMLIPTALLAAVVFALSA